MNHKAEIFVAIQRVMPKHLLSRLIGRLAESKIIWLKKFLIARAISYFDINMDEAMFNDQNSYRSFNDFFTQRKSLWIEFSILKDFLHEKSYKNFNFKVVYRKI